MTRLDGGVVVVTGEALVDLVLGPDGGLAGHPGGGPYNVARTIARLGQPAAYLGRLSSDRFGMRLREQLEADGVRLEAVVPTDAPTTLALAELDAAGAASYHFYFEGTSAPGLTLDLATAALPRDVSILYLGTLGLVFEPMATTLETLVSDAGAGTLVALDPNCRPATVEDPDSYRRRLARLLSRADLVKVSEQDLDWLYPGWDAVAAARALLGRDDAVALLTVGGDGAVVVTPEAGVEVRSPRVEVVDTIGAGDAFMGAFLARWHGQGFGRPELSRLDDVAAAAQFACMVAARTCARAGADPPRLVELGS